jgi:hypothetical protein
VINMYITEEPSNVGLQNVALSTLLNDGICIVRGRGSLKRFRRKMTTKLAINDVNV